MHILEVKNGCFGYTPDTPVLKDISFTVEPGQILAVMGRNGVGKTTLVKCISGILQWNSGESFVDGVPVVKGVPIKGIGYVPQAHSLIFPYSVRDVVVFGRLANGTCFSVPSKNDYDAADAAIEAVGISDIAEKPCDRLSGGQLQLVFLAKALVNDPKLLILDEPESHLDFANELTMLNMVKRMAIEKGMGCIINTHYPNNALRIADRCIIMGRDDHVEGDTKDVMNEDNVRKYFGVISKMMKFEYEGEEITSFTFIRRVDQVAPK